jgi:hypothetical protein
MPEAFCPQCGALLRRTTRCGEKLLGCRKCGFLAQAPRTSARASRIAKHPDFPLFPYDDIRGGQREFMADIRAADIEKLVAKVRDFFRRG